MARELHIVVDVPGRKGSYLAVHDTDTKTTHYVARFISPATRRTFREFIRSISGTVILFSAEDWPEEPGEPGQP